MRSLGWVQFNLTGVLMKREGRDTDAHRGTTAWGHREGTATGMPRKEASEGPC